MKLPAGISCKKDQNPREIYKSPGSPDNLYKFFIIPHHFMDEKEHFPITVVEGYGITRDTALLQIYTIF